MLPRKHGAYRSAQLSRIIEYTNHVIVTYSNIQMTIQLTIPQIYIAQNV